MNMFVSVCVRVNVLSGGGRRKGRNGEKPKKEMGGCVKRHVEILLSQLNIQINM